MSTNTPSPTQPQLASYRHESRMLVKDISHNTTLHASTTSSYAVAQLTSCTHTPVTTSALHPISYMLTPTMLRNTTTPAPPTASTPDSPSTRTIYTTNTITPPTPHIHTHWLAPLVKHPAIPTHAPNTSTSPTPPTLPLAYPPHHPTPLRIHLIIVPTTLLLALLSLLQYDGQYSARSVHLVLSAMRSTAWVTYPLQACV